MDFRFWAVLSALFAGLTAILAKKGVEGVPSNLALAVRVVEPMIALAHGFGMRVVAEGVETEAQRTRLEALGCDGAQGPAIAPPKRAASM